MMRVLIEIGLVIGSLIVGGIGGAFCYWYFVVKTKKITVPEKIELT